MSAGIIGRPACKLALCVALFMPIRLCDIVTADAPPAPGYPSDHRPGRTTWDKGEEHSVHNTQLCFVEQTFIFIFKSARLVSLQPALNFTTLLSFNLKRIKINKINHFLLKISNDKILYIISVYYICALYM